MKKEYTFFITTILAIFFEQTLFAKDDISSNEDQTSKCNEIFAETYSRADTHFKNRRFFLSAVNYSAAAAIGCNRSKRAEARFGYANSLYMLEENEAAFAEWTSLSTNRDINPKLRRSAQLQLALNFEKAIETPDPILQDSLSIWYAKEDANAFNDAVRHSHFSPQEKLQLSNLRPSGSALKNPLVSGLASGILPGSGQFYNGEYQTGAISFALNGVFLLSTIELAKKKLGYTAAISGVVFSTVYLGNIISAVQGANRINERKIEAEFSALKEHLSGLASSK